MSKNPNQTAYMYASSRIRALEAGIVGRDRIEQLVDAADVSELYTRLEEAGVTLVRDEGGKVLSEPTLLGMLKSSLDHVVDAAPVPELYDFLRYPYDCNNIKAAIKCYLRKLSPEGMLFDLGTVSAEDVAEMPVKGEFSGLPHAMAEAAPLALQAYKKTGNPRAIDLILDKACFADMLACVVAGGEEMHVRLVRMQIDLTNAMICLRLVRMGGGEQAKMLLDEALLEGGTLTRQTLLAAYDGGESALIDCLGRGGYDKLASALRESDGSAAAAERAVDDYRMELLRTVKYTPFGAPILSAYFYAQEYAVKNIRIVIAAKNAGLDPQTIRERIRTSYV